MIVPLRDIEYRTGPELVIDVAGRGVKVVVKCPVDDAVRGSPPRAVARKRSRNAVHRIANRVALPQPFERRRVGGVLHLALRQTRITDVDRQRQQGAQRKRDQRDLDEHV